MMWASVAAKCVGWLNFDLDCVIELAHQSLVPLMMDSQSYQGYL